MRERQRGRERGGWGGGESERERNKQHSHPIPIQTLNLHSRILSVTTKCLTECPCSAQEALDLPDESHFQSEWHCARYAVRKAATRSHLAVVRHRFCFFIFPFVLFCFSFALSSQLHLLIQHICCYYSRQPVIAFSLFSLSFSLSLLPFTNCCVVRFFRGWVGLCLSPDRRVRL